jgi:S-adenosylmethionine hydrolase
VFVCFLSDFGFTDDFVGTCHGVIKRIAPDAEIIDVTHGIPPQAVLQGALVLTNTLPYMPAGVHLAVVDPGVGGVRRAIAVADSEGRIFVGPDNGLLLPAAERAGIVEVRELANPEYALETISRTFHGRDLFAPAAAHLATGVPLAALGPPLAQDALVRLDLPVPRFSPGTIDAVALFVDSFGNIALNLTRDDIERAGVVPGTRVELELEGERYYAVAARTFADARPGDVILYEDSYRNMSIAISSGNAAALLHAEPGQELRIHLGDRPTGDRLRR